jgi:hypothetical protein
MPPLIGWKGNLENWRHARTTLVMVFKIRRNLRCGVDVGHVFGGVKGACGRPMYGLRRLQSPQQLGDVYGGLVTVFKRTLTAHSATGYFLRNNVSCPN